MTITGAANPVPVRYSVPVPSAQVKSAVLLAGLNAPGKTIVVEKEATRDHTERMLAGFGAEITTEETEEGRVITLDGPAGTDATDHRRAARSQFGGIPGLRCDHHAGIGRSGAGHRP